MTTTASTPILLSSGTAVTSATTPGTQFTALSGQLETVGPVMPITTTFGTFYRVGQTTTIDGATYEITKLATFTGNITYSDGDTTLTSQQFIQFSLANMACPADIRHVIGLPDNQSYPGLHSITYKGGFCDSSGTVGDAIWRDTPPGTTKLACFMRGTLIETDRGEIAVEDLKKGDLVRTVLHGDQPIRMIYSSLITARMLAREPKLRPVRIRAGCLGQGLPGRDLFVSPQHRMLVRSRIVQRMFNRESVLVPAIKLTEHDGIEQVDMDGVEYFHIVFDRHELVISNGTLSESLYPGPQALEAVPAECRAEIENLFPGIFEGASSPEPAAKFVSKRAQVSDMVRRHNKNGAALVN